MSLGDYVDVYPHPTDLSVKIRVFHSGTIHWLKKDKLHRADGPAIEQADGGKVWYVDDKPHRVDGPAVEEIDGTKEWYVKGRRHRTDGPAIEFANGNKEWYRHGVKITQEECTRRTLSSQAECKLERCIDWAAPMNWTAGNGLLCKVMDFLIAVPEDVVPRDVMQKAFAHGMEHNVDGPALLAIETVDDVREAFGIQSVGHCLKLRKHIQETLHKVAAR